MEQVQNRPPSLKAATHWIISVLGTFLFVFFMMAGVVIFTSGMRSAYWSMPLFVIPSCMVCITFGASYWIGANKTRLWSYCISNFIATLILVPTAVSFMTYSVSMMILRIVATILLPIIPILYGIRMVRMEKNKDRRANETVQTPQSMRTQMILRKVIRVLCLLSVCCVLFENLHRAISTMYYHLTRDGITLIPGLIAFPLSILSAILLAKFMKAEFVQWKPSPDSP